LPFRNFGLQSALASLVRELRSGHIGLLCTHGFKADILGLLAARLSGVPDACFLRGWTRENKKVRVYEALARSLLPLAHRIVCLSENQAQRLMERRWAPSRIRIVPNAVDLPDSSPGEIARMRRRVRELFGFPLQCTLVASAGRLSPEKGVAVFIDAAARLRGKHPGAYFIVFGEGPLRRDLEVRAKRLGLDGHLLFAGFVPRLREFLHGLDILVNPSFSEEMPNIVLEAMAAEVPVVATSVGGVPEIAGPDRAVSLAPPGDAEALAQAVSSILRDPFEARRLAVRGRARVGLVYSLIRQRELLHTLYRELLSPGRAKIVRESVSPAKLEHLHP